MNRRRWAVAAAASCLGVVVMASAQCRRGPPSEVRAPDEPSVAAEPSRDPASIRAGTEENHASAGASTTPGEEDRGQQGSTFTRLTGRHAENDLRLIAEVQRVTGREPPTSIERLIALRRSDGANEASLRQHIAAEVDGLSLKAAARRWLEREFPSSSPPSMPPGSGAPAVPAPTKRLH